MADVSSSAADSWIPIGTHVYCLHSPDTIIFRARGDLNVSDIRAFGNAVMALPRPAGGFFYIVNTSRLRHQSAQTIQELRAIPPDLFRVTALVGAGFAQRTLLETMLRIARFLKVSFNERIAVIFATEEEALAHFERIRRGAE